MSDPSFTVSRHFAAEILNVSVRTLDRYTKSSKISSARRGRQLFYNEQELLNHKARQLAQQQLEQVHQMRHGKHISSQQAKPNPSSRQQGSDAHRDFVQVKEARSMEQEGTYDELDGEFANIRDSLLRRSPEESIFRSLFNKAEEEIKDLRNQLQLANYKVGKLDAQLESMVPLIDFKRQKQELLELAQENRTKHATLNDLENALRVERWIKRIYAAFLFFMMALMPLLVILRLYS